MEPLTMIIPVMMVFMMMSMFQQGGGGGDGGVVVPQYFFKFGTPTATRAVYPPATGWSIPLVTCQLTNENEVAATRTIAVWMRGWYSYYGEIVHIEPRMIAGSIQTVTLDAGGTTTYQYSGGDDPQPPLLQQQTTWYFWLEDDLGNISDEASFST